MGTVVLSNPLAAKMGYISQRVRCARVTVTVTRTVRKDGDRIFAKTAAHLWNNQLASLRDSDSITALYLSYIPHSVEEVYRFPR